METKESLQQKSKHANSDFLTQIKNESFRLVLDGTICLADSFEFMINHCTILKAVRHK